MCAHVHARVCWVHAHACIGVFAMKDIKTYLSMALMVVTLWFSFDCYIGRDLSFTLEYASIPLFYILDFRIEGSDEDYKY